jgi:pimeloyl-ACP methyl ester carboxylesterase
MAAERRCISAAIVNLTSCCRSFRKTGEQETRMTKRESSQSHAPRRAKSALRATLLFGGFFLANAATAQTPSVEFAAKTAGLPVKSATANVNQVDIFYRDVGAGDRTVILLHGFPETGDALAPAVAALGGRYRLIIPDLRGFGRSQRPASGYDKETVATDIKLLIDQLGIKRVDLVGYDIGARVAYAFALQYPDSLRSLTVAEAFIEGLAGTAQLKQIAPNVPRLKHFAEFADADASEQRYLGKEDELILWFMNSRTKAKQFTSDDVAGYVASFRRDRGMWAAFKHYQALDQDAAYVQGADISKSAGLPILTIGCADGGGDTLERQLKQAGFTNIKPAVLGGCVHWIFDEAPAETIRTIGDFIAAASR